MACTYNTWIHSDLYEILGNLADLTLLLNVQQIG